VAAIRRGQYELAVGDLIGSCIVDATVAVGLGPLLFPITVSGRDVMVTGLYALVVSIVVVSTLSLRVVHDRKSGSLFILLYLSSFLLLYLP
jgi:Ca2+/Na+ antiporter